MNEDGVRKSFEAWALSERLDVRRLGDGRYLLLTVQEKWVGWQAATRAAVPDGWKVVPSEPTPEMIKEGEKAHWSKEMDKMSPTPTEFYDECGGPIGYAWVAMLAAAPEVKP